MQSDFLVRAPWLDEERVTAYAWIFALLYVAGAVFWIALSPQLIDPHGKPIGTDFMNVWAAGKMALAGEPGAAYDFARHYEVQAQALPYAAEGKEATYFGWHYPPFFMLVAALLALLPYGAALAAWMAVTLVPYLAAIRSIVPYRRWLLFALAFPAVFVNLGHGQNGFLSAGLLGLGLLTLERRPALAGLFFGLLTYKPQMGFLLPLVLLVDRQWIAFLTAAATALAMSLISYLMLGAEVWQGFFGSFETTRTYILEQGATGWEKIQSPFSAARMLGAGIQTAYAVHFAIALAVSAIVLWIWRGPVSIPLKGAALATGTLLVTPYVLDYDLMLLALPLAWLTVEGLRTQFLNWEKLTLFIVWLLPLLSRSIGSFGVPIAPIVLLVLLSFIYRRARESVVTERNIAAQPA
jgi:hypothetical protein